MTLQRFALRPAEPAASDRKQGMQGIPHLHRVQGSGGLGSRLEVCDDMAAAK
jgi:hypothetical protein